MKTGLRIGFWLLVLLFHLGIPNSSKADALDQWAVRPSGATGTLFSAAYGNGQFVVVGSDGILNSTNCQNWGSHTFNQYPPFNCVSYGAGTFVVGALMFPNGTNVFASTNGVDWSGFYAGTNVNFLDASYAAGVFLLSGASSTILTATNIDFSCAAKWPYTNCNWTLRTSGYSEPLRGITFGNGLFVAVGTLVAMVSSNLNSWTTNVNPFLGSVAFGVTFGNGLFVAVAAGTKLIFTSTNGSQWTMRLQSSSYSLYGVTFANGLFVAVGSAGAIVTSTDGITWTKRPPPTTADLRGITYGNGTFVATGTGGTIIQSGSFSIPALSVIRALNDSGINLAMSGEIGRGYRIQTRTNLAEGDWEDFLSFTNTGPVMEFLDTSVTNLPSRFYRAVSP